MYLSSRIIIINRYVRPQSIHITYTNISGMLLDMIGPRHQHCDIRKVLRDEVG